MISSGREPGDEGYDEWLEYTQEEYRLDALQEEAEGKFVLDNVEWIASLLASMQGKKRAAVLKLEKQKRLTLLGDAIAPILAERPNITDKEVAYELKKMDPAKFGSGNTIRLIGQIRKRSEK